MAAFLAGCMDNGAGGPSTGPDVPWSPGGAGASDYAVSGDAVVGEVSRGVRAGKTYDLPELIDLAQRSNPVTRVAWEQARQAALLEGMVEATFLPIITANVIGGNQQIVTPVRKLGGGTENIETTAEGVASNLALQWLVFDFGQRKAWQQAAQQNAYAANVSFNGTHQALIYNVSRTYFQYGAAQQRLAIANKAVVNSKGIQEAAETRFNQGIATSVEVAQAKQLVAQSNLRRVVAQDLLRDSYQDMLAAVGISPKSEIKVTSAAGRRLPSFRSEPTDKIIEAALRRRPDVLASYAAVRASEANARAADAEFKPKVFLSGIAGNNSANLQTGNLQSVGAQSTATGLAVGISIPIYDGGIREAQQKRSRSAIAEAEQVFEQTQNAAVREIIVSTDTLRSALQSYDAASELTKATEVTYDAALDAYKNGLGSITDATAAETALLDARDAQADAHAASLIAASTLAFALGAMTSSAAPWRAISR